MVSKVSEKLGNQLHTEIVLMIKKAVCQQLDVLLLALLESEIHVSLDVVRMDWIASLEEKLAQTIEKIAPTITNELSLDLQVFIEKKMFSQV